MRGGTRLLSCCALLAQAATLFFGCCWGEGAEWWFYTRLVVEGVGGVVWRGEAGWIEVRVSCLGMCLCGCGSGAGEWE